MLKVGQMSVMQTLRPLEIAGFFFISFLGSLLHFVFAWSNNWTPLALFAAVNESVWEHLKLAFWPGVLWAIIELLALPKLNLMRFWAIKGLSLLVAPITIILVFYGYTQLLGHNLLILDIGTFFLAIALGQAAFLWLFKHSRVMSRTLIRAGLACLSVQVLAYSLLTYYPPNLPLFIDQRNGLRGILPAEAETNPSVHWN